MTTTIERRRQQTAARQQRFRERQQEGVLVLRAEAEALRSRVETMRAKITALSAKIEAQQIENAALKAALRDARQVAKSKAVTRRDRLGQYLWPTAPRK
jgi:hypothetical protein